MPENRFGHKEYKGHKEKCETFVLFVSFVVPISLSAELPEVWGRSEIRNPAQTTERKLPSKPW
jgi:hypothetical protein